MLKNILFLLCFFIVVSISISGRAEETKFIPGRPYYYGSFSGYHIPFKPSEPLTYEEAIKRAAYYIAYYDEQDRIISFAKYLKGTLLFKSEYFYRSSGVLEREEVIDEKGETKIYYYDEKGKLIKTDSVAPNEK